MFDIGWGELFLIGVVALIVVGPKELPTLFRTVGNFTGKARGMAREFQRSLEQAANETGMNEVSESLKALDRINLSSPVDTARKLAADAAKGPAMPPVGKAAEPAPASDGSDPDATAKPEPVAVAEPAPVAAAAPAPAPEPAPEPAPKPAAEAAEPKRRAGSAAS